MQKKAHYLRLWLDLVSDAVIEPSESRNENVLPASQHQFNHFSGLEGMSRDQIVGFRQPSILVQPIIW